MSSGYYSLEAQLHDVFWEGNTDELFLLKEFFDLYGKGKSLEIGCGSGRLLLPLLGQGYEVEGLEISKDMIELLQQQSRDEDVRDEDVVVHQSAIEEFLLPQGYQSFLLTSFMLQLLEREKAKELLIRLREYFTSKGALFLTLFIPWAEIVGELPEGEWYDDHAAKMNGEVATCRTRYQVGRLSQTLVREHEYRLKGRAHNSTQRLHWYYHQEMLLLLEQCGWKVTRVRGDLSLEEKLGSETHVFTYLCETT